MESVNTDTRALEERLSQLQAHKKAKTLELSGVEALVEASFRLGTDSETPPNEAIRLLLQAHRLDGANPKYAYHLARIFYLGADFDRASKWLKRAVQLCPTSHRLWAHVTLLQRDLNAQYHGQYEFKPDDLRNCATRISAYIREGEDRFNDTFLRFEPHPSMASLEAKARQNGQSNVSPQECENVVESEVFKSAQRLTDAGCCRWSGIFDLTAEEILEAQPSKRALDQLLPLLTYTARTARFRKGGIAAFAILGVQTLVCGYPVEPVVFLRRTLPPDLKLPSLTLLDHVCQIFQSPFEKIPGMLAASLSQKRLPPVLAALIHHRLVLAPQSLDIRAFGKYKRGRKLLMTVRDAVDIDDDTAHRQNEEIAELSKAIQQANKAFAPKTIKKLDVPSTHFLADIPVENIAAKHRALTAIVNGLSNVQERLNQAVHAVEIDNCEAPVAWAQLTAAMNVLDELKLRADKASHGLDTLLSATFALDVNDLSKNFRSETESGRRMLNRILYDTLISQRIRTKREKLPQDVTATTLPPDAELVQLQTALQNLLSDSAHTQTLDPKAEFKAIESATSALKACKDRAWVILKQELAQEAKQADTDDRLKQALADHGALEEFVSALKKASKGGAEQLNDIIEVVAQTKDTNLIPDFDQRQNACRQKIRELTTLGNFLKVLNRVAKALAKAGASPGGEASTTITELINQARGAFKQTSTNEPANTPPKKKELSAETEQQLPDGRVRPQEPLEGLEYDLDEFKERIGRHFASLAASFEPYASLKTLPALQDLYTSLLDRQAHTLAGLGHRRKARQLWNKVLLQDRLNTNALKNIAICDTFGDDVGRTLASWRAYAETTYFLAVARGNPTPGASERADFHHQFGGAFAPAELSQPLNLKEGKKVDPIALSAFLRSPTRVRLFVEHKLIAFLNSKLQFTSPPIILGTGRTDSETLRRQARERLLAFVEKTQELLPERTRNAFTSTVLMHLRQAYDTCKSAKLLTLENDRRYPAEKVQHEQWIKDVCNLKIRVYQTIMDNLDIVLDIPSPSFFTELLRLDDIPIDQRPAFLQAIGAKMGIPDPEMLQDLMHLMQRQVATKVVNEAQDNGEPDRYLPLLLMLVARDGLDPNLPHALMKMAMTVALKKKNSDGHEKLADTINRWIQRAQANCEAKGKPEEQEISQIESALDDCLLQIFLAPSGGIGEDPVWSEREEMLAEFIAQYPNSGTGHFLIMISRQQISVQKYNNGETKDASAYFEKAVGAARNVLAYSQNEDHRDKANELLEGAGMFRQNVGLTAAKDGNFSEALDQLLPALKTKDATPDMVRQVMNIFVKQARGKKDGSEHGKMAKAVNAWLKDARKSDSSIDDKEISTVKDMLDEHLTMMLLAPLGELNEKADWSAVESAMRAAQKTYPQNVSARYYRMVALYRLANQQADAGDRTHAKKSLATAAEEASVVIDRSHNKSYCEQAKNIHDQIMKVLG